jgi:hypothetical protein
MGTANDVISFGSCCTIGSTKWSKVDVFYRAEKYNDYKKVAKETGVSVATIKRYLLLLNLSSSLQERVNTSEGSAGVGVLSKLAETFSPQEQEKALNEIGGFKQNIQLEIIKRSGGDLNKLLELKWEAMEGAFDTRMCAEGLVFRCPKN